MMNWLQLLSSKRPGSSLAREDQNVIRTAFEQDYDRIIFSSPFRMLQDKTQVFPMPKHDFVHTRLTHSLEVSSVGRSLGKKAGEVLISRHHELQKNQVSSYEIGSIVAAASLTHDLGNPPFGHSGEDAISGFFMHNPAAANFKEHVNDQEWEDLVNFEGNAQGFRLLNKQQYQGLKLTCATLAAFTKYPRPSLIAERDKSRKSQKKYGFYATEAEIFKQVANETGLINLVVNQMIWTRHPLAFLVEAADDICYHIIDLEDGCNAGLVSFETTRDLMAMIIGKKYQPQKLDRIPNQREKVGLLRALAIGELITQATTLFLDEEQAILQGDFDKALTNIIPAAPVLAEIIKLSVDKIYKSQQVLDIEAAGFEVIDGLLEMFLLSSHAVAFSKQATPRHWAIFRLLPPEIKYLIEEGKNVYPYLVVRQVLDFISGLTDSNAISLYRKIKGISLV